MLVLVLALVLVLVAGIWLGGHPENLPPGSDRRYDVPFVTGGRSTKFAIMSHPVPGTEVLRIVALPCATWQATRELYVVKRP